MNTYTHNPTPVEAVQVTRPIVNVQKKVPFARAIKGNGGRFAFFLVTDPKDVLARHEAHEGDWILRHPDGRYETMTDDKFQVLYGDNDDSADAADD